MALVSCQNLRVALGGHTLLEDETLHIERRERIGLLGRNGEGKSTLLKVIARDLAPAGGTVRYAAGATVARLTQRVPSGVSETVEGLIRGGLREGLSATHPIERICSLLKLDPTQSFASLSGGQKRRVLLGRALVSEPDLLLLDEPTNHLDLDSIQWLETFLSRFQGSLLFVTHDRAFLRSLATRIIELDRGHLTSWECNYPTYLRRKEALLLGEQKQWDTFDKNLAKEEVWLRQGVKARRTRNEGRVRALEELRAERAARRERLGQAEINIQDAPRSGRKVIRAKHVDFTYRGPVSAECPEAMELPILRDFSATILRGDKVGVMGPNGCGKTTLLNVLLGRVPPESGTVEHGTRLEVSYFDQHRHQLDDALSVFDNVADGSDTVVIDGRRRHLIGYLQDFLFTPDRSKMPVRCLSGGERNRLLLARLFTRSSNVLVLDEPTNDLDTETLELLEARLVDYTGTVLVVSHDRQFLDNLCTSTFVFDGDGEVREYAGGYSDWQRCRPAQAPKPAAPAPIPRSRQTGSTSTKKLSNREREEWSALPGTIERLEQEQAQLEAAMANPEFFRRDAGEVRLATQRAKLLPEEVERAYARWAELDERR